MTHIWTGQAMFIQVRNNSIQSSLSENVHIKLKLPFCDEVLD